MNHITANEAHVIAFFEKALEEGDLNGGMGGASWSHQTMKSPAFCLSASVSCGLKPNKTHKSAYI